MAKPSTWLPTDPPDNETNDDGGEKKRSALMWAAAIGSVLLVFAVPLSFDHSIKSKQDAAPATVTEMYPVEVTVTETVTKEVAPATAPAPEPKPEAPPAPPRVAITDGVHRVGTDIEPGTYRSTGTGRDCYWARLSGFSGVLLEDTLANNISPGQSVVTIEPGDAGFESVGCGTWEKM